MIRTALEFISVQLDAYMVDRENDATYTASNVVDLTTITLPDGTINVDASKHITVMLVGLDEERREGKRSYYIPTDDKQFMRLQAPVELDVSVLFCAHSNDYPTALRDLSDVISFFQANPVFDGQKYPSLNNSVTAPDQKPWQLIDRLSFSLHSLSFEQQNNMWSMIGAKYMPGAVYKMKMLTVFETRGKEKVQAINEINYSGGAI
jgi:hypothetical protein